VRYSWTCLVKRRSALQGCNRPSRSQIEGCVDGFAIRVPGKRVFPGARLDVPPRHREPGCWVPTWFWAFAIVPANNRLPPTIPAIDVPEPWLRKPVRDLFARAAMSHLGRGCVENSGSTWFCRVRAEDGAPGPVSALPRCRRVRQSNFSPRYGGGRPVFGKMKRGLLIGGSMRRIVERCPRMGLRKGCGQGLAGRVCEGIPRAKDSEDDLTWVPAARCGGVLVSFWKC